MVRQSSFYVSLYSRARTPEMSVLGLFFVFSGANPHAGAGSDAYFGPLFVPSARGTLPSLGPVLLVFSFFPDSRSRFIER